MWQFVERFHVPIGKQNFMDALSEQFKGGFRMSAYKDTKQGTWYVVIPHFIYSQIPSTSSK